MSATTETYEPEPELAPASPPRPPLPPNITLNGTLGPNPDDWWTTSTNTNYTFTGNR